MNKRTQLKREAERLLNPGSGKVELRLMVKGEPYKTLIVTGSKDAVIDCPSKEGCDVVERFITDLQNEVEYFRDGRPIPITGVIIKKA